MVLDRWMTFLTTQRAACGERTGDKGNSLIKLYVRSDFRRLANHHPRAMVDKEMAANFGAGMNVDSGPTVSPFRHHPRNERKIGQIKNVRHALNRDRFDRRIGQDNFFEA